MRNAEQMADQSLIRLTLTISIGLLLLSACGKDTSPIVVTHQATLYNLDATQFNLHGTVMDEGGSAVTKRGFCWGLDSLPDINGNHSQDTVEFQFDTKAFSHVINFLQDTTYHVRAYAINISDTAYGNEMSFSTAGPFSGTFIDSERDGSVYQWVKIGDQIWMAQNLAYLPFVTGNESGSDSLPYYYVYGYDSTDVASAKKFTTRDSTNYKIYGVLYNWPATKKACPAGWRMPSDKDWELLMITIGGNAGGKLKERGGTHWKDPNKGATNENGFSALGGGERYSLGGFIYLNQSAEFWSSDSSGLSNAFAWHLSYFANTFKKDYFNKSNGFSVRCIKDEEK